MSNVQHLPKSPETIAEEDAALTVLAADLKRLEKRARKAGLHHLAKQIRRIG